MTTKRHTKTIREAGRLGAIMSVATVAIMALVAVPAQAAPAPSPIRDRESYVLTDSEWEALWQIECQCNEVMCGERTSTIFSVDADKIFGRNEWEYTDASFTAIRREDGTTEGIGELEARLSKELQHSMDRIMRTLLTAKPSLASWMDEIHLYSSAWVWSTQVRGDKAYLIASPLEVSCKIASECATDRPYEVSPAGISRLRECVSVAQAIADLHAEEPAIQRLASYSNEIYARTSYAYGISMDSLKVDSRPWTITSVFDGDASTTSYCEAYSKALKLLVELSGKDDLQCHTIGGNVTSHKGTIPHMWCSVKMPNQKTYLSDITNNQADTVGTGQLLLATANGSVEGGYSVRLSSETFTYRYDQLDKEFYDWSTLTITDTPYEPEAAPTPEPAKTRAESVAESVPNATREEKHEEATSTSDEPQQTEVEEESQDQEQRQDWTIPTVRSAKIRFTTEEMTEAMGVAETPSHAENGWVIPAACALFATALLSLPLLAIRIVRPGRE